MLTRLKEKCNVIQNIGGRRRFEKMRMSLPEMGLVVGLLHSLQISMAISLAHSLKKMFDERVKLKRQQWRHRKYTILKRKLCNFFLICRRRWRLKLVPNLTIFSPTPR